MSEKQIEEIEIQEAVEQAESEQISQKDFYRKIGMPVPNDLHMVDVGSHIIQHMTHSFDEHGNVIVVEGDKEDLWQSIPQYQDEVGPANIIRMIEAGADPMALLNANKNNAVYGDFTDLDAASVNELKGKVDESSEAAVKALKAFNEQFGTSLDMSTFLDLYSKGLLQSHIEGVNTKEESTNE